MEEEAVSRFFAQVHAIETLLALSTDVDADSALPGLEAAANRERQATAGGAADA
jgi:hypothetical protein